MIGESEALRDGVLDVAKLMAVAAKTAPKARGIDNIKILILNRREELEELAKSMEELAEKYGAFFKRDADNVRNSDVVVLIGATVVDLGLKTPEDYIADINLVMALLNLGIALGSAVKTAGIHNVDNRIMYT
ncbi:MAG TPA: ferredoxin, partial [Desulfurococcales archaeon]|nr:ferredoxin [Desulfurococcales archaeon]